MFSKNNMIIFTLLVLLFILIFYNTIKMTNFNPLVFCVFLISIFVVFNFLDLNVGARSLFTIFFLYILISTILLFFSRSYDPQTGRFTGFVLTATIYSIYIEVIAIILISNIPGRTRKIFIYLFFIPFLLLANTRLNLAFYAILPFLYIIYSKWRKNRLVFFILLVLSINFIYPVYGYLYKNDYLNIENRYKEGRDASFSLRNALFTAMIEEIEDMNLKSLLIGKGAGYTVKLIEDNFTEKLKPHQDFLRFFIDFGVLGSLLFFFFLFKIMFKNRCTFLLASLYFISFYHNMLYARELIGVLIFFYFANIKKPINLPYFKLSKT
jgi:hypothetical protein